MLMGWTSYGDGAGDGSRKKKRKVHAKKENRRSAREGIVITPASIASVDSVSS